MNLGLPTAVALLQKHPQCVSLQSHVGAAQFFFSEWAGVPASLRSSDLNETISPLVSMVWKRPLIFWPEPSVKALDA